MLIECTIRRQNGSTAVLNGKTYRFTPNAEGQHVAEVTDPAALDILLATDVFVPADGSAPLPIVAKPDLGAANIDEMSRKDLMEYAEAMGLKITNKNLKTDLLRTELVRFVEARTSGEAFGWALGPQE